MINRREASNRRPRPPREPKLPTGLQRADEVQCQLEHEQTVRATTYLDIDLTATLADGVEFDRCDFRKTGFAAAHLPGVRFTDCAVTTCDLSNLRAEKARLERVAVSGCRATGMALTDGILTDVTVADSKADLTNWRFTRFAAVTFRDCNLSGADFTEADLRGASFTGCDLSGAQFHKAKMAGARFRTCRLGGVGGITEWAGAVIHPDDLLELSYILAGALGIVIKAD
jgi:uncharacterized protein YjbI with pentapeptide repeats